MGRSIYNRSVCVIGFQQRSANARLEFSTLAIFTSKHKHERSIEKSERNDKQQ